MIHDLACVILKEKTKKQRKIARGKDIDSKKKKQQTLSEFSFV